MRRKIKNKKWITAVLAAILLVCVALAVTSIQNNQRKNDATALANSASDICNHHAGHVFEHPSGDIWVSGSNESKVSGKENHFIGIDKVMADDGSFSPILVVCLSETLATAEESCGEYISQSGPVERQIPSKITLASLKVTATAHDPDSGEEILRDWTTINDQCPEVVEEPLEPGDEIRLVSKSQPADVEEVLESVVEKAT